LITGLNPGDAEIRGCLNICASITKFYLRFARPVVPGFSLPGRGWSRLVEAGAGAIDDWIIRAKVRAAHEAESEPS